MLSEERRDLGVRVVQGKAVHGTLQVLSEGALAGQICLALLLSETNIGMNLLSALGPVVKRPGPKPGLYHHILPLM